MWCYLGLSHRMSHPSPPKAVYLASVILMVYKVDVVAT
jgi:hypothetical protein